MDALDAIRLHFDPRAFTLLNVILGLVMFGVALDLRVEDFRRVVREPRAPAIGLVAQFLVLPAATWLLTRAVDLPASVRLGMLLVASCPGGNLSNYLTHLAGGRTVLSIGMTAVSTVGAIGLLPLNLVLWGSLSEDTAALLREVRLDPAEMLRTVALLLGVPLVAGMTLAARAPRLAAALRRPFAWLSVLFLVGFIGVAFSANSEQFVAYVGRIAPPVALHNALALGLGFAIARLAGLAAADVRAVTIEVGIQNSGLGLFLVFGFFEGLGGMAVIAAWWGIWHLIAGLAVAGAWSRRPPDRD